MSSVCAIREKLKDKATVVVFVEMVVFETADSHRLALKAAPLHGKPLLKCCLGFLFCS